MLFEKKKIQIETLSEYLVSVRNNLQFPVGEVSQKAGVPLKFLAALESGSFKLLPADVYVFGFLKQLANLYSVDGEELIKQYKKEKGIQKQLDIRSEEIGAVWYRKIFRKLVVTPKIVSVVLGLLFVAVTLGYIIWQVWLINTAPKLNISSPANNAVISGASVEIQGATDPGMAVAVNGQNIFVDSNGNFQTQLGVSPGPEQIVISSSNRFGKSVSSTLNITGAAQAVANTLVLKVSFTGPVALGFAVDGQPAQTQNFNSGDTRIFTASQQVLLSTSDAGSTDINLNGQNLGAMGKPKEQLTDVPFTPPSQ